MSERVVKVRLSAQGQDYVSTMKSAALATKAVADAGDAMSSKSLSAFSRMKAGGVAMGAAVGGAVDRAQSAFNRLGEAAKAQGASVNGASEASVQFRDALRGMDSASMDAARAILNNGGSVAQATETYRSGRQAILDHLEAKGMDAASARTWADANISAAKSSEQAIREYGKAAEEASKKGLLKAASTEEWRSVATTLTVVGGAVTALGVASLKTGIQYNQLQQTTRAALTTLLGSAQAANEQMDKLDDFARKSPFSKATFIQAQQQMLAFGIETKKVIPYMDALQDATAAAGGSNQQLGELAFVMAQISAAGKITAQDLMQFGQRGVNAADLIGKSMGKTGAQIRAEITNGTLGANDALDALAEGMKDRFGGAAANVKNTFGGAMDRVSAAWRDFSAELAKPLVNPNGGGSLVELLNWSADAMRNFQKLPEPAKNATTAVAGIAGAGALAAGSLMLLVPRIVEVQGAFVKLAAEMPRTSAALGSVAKWGGYIAAAAAAAAILPPVVDALAESVFKYSDAARNLTGEQKSLSDSFGELVHNGASWSTVAANAGDVLDRLGDLDQFFTYIGALDETGKAAVGLSTALKQLSPALAAMPVEQSTKQFQGYVAELGATDQHVLNMLENMQEFKNQLIATARSQGVAATDANLLALALGRTTTETKNASDATDGATESTEDFEKSLKDAENRLSTMEKALKGVAGEAMGMGDALDKAQSTLNRMADAADGGSASLYGTNNESIKLRDSMRDVESAHRDAAQAIIENRGSVEDAMVKWAEGRQRIIEMRIAMDESAEEATAWADTNLGSADRVRGALNDVKTAVDNIPTNIQTQVDLINLESAQARVAAWKDALNSIPTYKGVTVDTIMGNPSMGYRAPGSYMGNLYEHGKPKAFYQGGFASGIYAGVRGGIHKFAESEMGVPWETYISGRAADRDRNIGIWQETGRRLGVGGGASAEDIARAVASVIGGSGRGSVSLSIVNPVVRDVERDAWEAAQTFGGML